MQITLNKIPFDVRPVAEPMRRALLTDPLIAPGLRRAVWSWDAATGQGSYLLPLAPDGALPLPSGLVAWVSKAGANGLGPQKAEGPTQKMAERFLAAVGAKTFQQVMQALTRVTGLPRRKLPLEAFAGLKEHGAHRIRMESDLSVVELSNGARNLQVYLLLPSLVAFGHAWDGEAPEGAPAPGSIRPGFVVPAPTQAAAGLRRLAVNQRLSELQAQLAGLNPAELPEADPRRALLARLAVEARALQPKAPPPKAA